MSGEIFDTWLLCPEWMKDKILSESHISPHPSLSTISLLSRVRQSFWSLLFGTPLPPLIPDFSPSVSFGYNGHTILFFADNDTDNDGVGELKLYIIPPNFPTDTALFSVIKIPAPRLLKATPQGLLVVLTQSHSLRVICPWKGDTLAKIPKRDFENLVIRDILLGTTTCDESGESKETSTVLIIAEKSLLMYHIPSHIQNEEKEFGSKPYRLSQNCCTSAPPQLDLPFSRIEASDLFSQGSLYRLLLAGPLKTGRTTIEYIVVLLDHHHHILARHNFQNPIRCVRFIRAQGAFFVLHTNGTLSLFFNATFMYTFSDGDGINGHGITSASVWDSDNLILTTTTGDIFLFNIHCKTREALVEHSVNEPESSVVLTDSNAVNDNDSRAGYFFLLQSHSISNISHRDDFEREESFRIKNSIQVVERITLDEMFRRLLIKQEYDRALDTLENIERRKGQLSDIYHMKRFLETPADIVNVSRFLSKIECTFWILEEILLHPSFIIDRSPKLLYEYVSQILESLPQQIHTHCREILEHITWRLNLYISIYGSDESGLGFDYSRFHLFTRSNLLQICLDFLNAGDIDAAYILLSHPRARIELLPYYLSLLHEIPLPTSLSVFRRLLMIPSKLDVCIEESDHLPSSDITFDSHLTAIFAEPLYQDSIQEYLVLKTKYELPLRIPTKPPPKFVCPYTAESFPPSPDQWSTFYTNRIHRIDELCGDIDNCLHLAEFAIARCVPNLELLYHDLHDLAQLIYVDKLPFEYKTNTFLDLSSFSALNQQQKFGLLLFTTKEDTFLSDLKKKILPNKENADFVKDVIKAIETFIVDRNFNFNYLILLFSALTVQKDSSLYSLFQPHIETLVATTHTLIYDIPHTSVFFSKIPRLLDLLDSTAPTHNQKELLVIARTHFHIFKEYLSKYGLCTSLSFLLSIHNTKDYMKLITKIFQNAIKRQTDRNVIRQMVLGTSYWDDVLKDVLDVHTSLCADYLEKTYIYQAFCETMLKLSKYKLITKYFSLMDSSRSENFLLTSHKQLFNNALSHDDESFKGARHIISLVEDPTSLHSSQLRAEFFLHQAYIKLMELCPEIHLLPVEIRHRIQEPHWLPFFVKKVFQVSPSLYSTKTFDKLLNILNALHKSLEGNRMTSPEPSISLLHAAHFSFAQQAIIQKDYKIAYNFVEKIFQTPDEQEFSTSNLNKGSLVLDPISMSNICQQLYDHFSFDKEIQRTLISYILYYATDLETIEKFLCLANQDLNEENNTSLSSSDAKELFLAFKNLPLNHEKLSTISFEGITLDENNYELLFNFLLLYSDSCEETVIPFLKQVAQSKDKKFWTAFASFYFFWQSQPHKTRQLDSDEFPESFRFSSIEKIQGNLTPPWDKYFANFKASVTQHRNLSLLKGFNVDMENFNLDTVYRTSTLQRICRENPEIFIAFCTENKIDAIPFLKDNLLEMICVTRGKSLLTHFQEIDDFVFVTKPTFLTQPTIIIEALQSIIEKGECLPYWNIYLLYTVWLSLFDSSGEKPDEELLFFHNKFMLLKELEALKCNRSINFFTIISSSIDELLSYLAVYADSRTIFKFAKLLETILYNQLQLYPQVKSRFLHLYLLESVFICNLEESPKILYYKSKEIFKHLAPAQLHSFVDTLCDSRDYPLDFFEILFDDLFSLPTTEDNSWITNKQAIAHLLLFDRDRLEGFLASQKVINLSLPRPPSLNTLKPQLISLVSRVSYEDMRHLIQLIGESDIEQCLKDIYKENICNIVPAMTRQPADPSLPLTIPAELHSYLLPIIHSLIDEHIPQPASLALVQHLVSSCGKAVLKETGFSPYLRSLKFRSLLGDKVQEHLERLCHLNSADVPHVLEEDILPLAHTEEQFFAIASALFYLNPDLNSVEEVEGTKVNIFSQTWSVFFSYLIQHGWDSIAVDIKYQYNINVSRVSLCGLCDEETLLALFQKKNTSTYVNFSLNSYYPSLTSPLLVEFFPAIPRPVFTSIKDFFTISKKVMMSKVLFTTKTLDIITHFHFLPDLVHSEVFPLAFDAFVSSFHKGKVSASILDNFLQKTP